MFSPQDSAGIHKCIQCGSTEHMVDCQPDGSFETVCLHCGYYYREGWAYDEEKEEFVLDSNGDRVWETREEIGFGAYIYPRPDHHHVGGLPPGISEVIPLEIGRVEGPEDFAAVKRMMEKDLAAGLLRGLRFRLTRWNEATQKVEFVLGNFPKVLEDQGIAQPC